jgi:hypothetical protein
MASVFSCGPVYVLEYPILVGCSSCCAVFIMNGMNVSIVHTFREPCVGAGQDKLL